MPAARLRDPNTMDSRVVGLPLPLLLVLPLRRTRWRRWPVAGEVDARRWPADNHLLLLPLLPTGRHHCQATKRGGGGGEEERERERERRNATDTTASSP